MIESAATDEARDTDGNGGDTDAVDYGKLYGRNLPIDEESIELGRAAAEMPKVCPYVSTEIRHGKRNWEAGIKGEF